MNENEEERARANPPEGEPSGKPTEDEHRAGNEEAKQARTGSVLLLGGILTWKVGKAAAKLLLPRSITERVASRSSAQGGESEPEHLSPTAEKLIHASVAGLEGARAAASAVAGYISEKVSELSPAEEQKGPDEGRAGDRNLDREKGLNPERRERWGTVFVLLACGCAFAGGIGFLFIYWTGGNNLLLGGSLAIFLGGLATTLVLWAHWLTVHKEAVEPREPLSSSVQDRRAVSREYRDGEHDVQRRGLLLWMAGGAAAFAATFVISLLKSLGFPPSTAVYTHVWKRGQRLMTLDKQPVSVNALRPGDMMLVFPEDSIGSQKSQTVLIRVQDDLLHLPPERSDWAPMGYVAYSRVCTHAGCVVGMYEKTTHLLMCPCHQSTFDVLRAAQPTGGPAARPLPQLPLYADSQGILHAADGFTNPPGPGYWGMP